MILIDFCVKLTENVFSVVFDLQNVLSRLERFDRQSESSVSVITKIANVGFSRTHALCGQFTCTALKHHSVNCTANTMRQLPGNQSTTSYSPSVPMKLMLLFIINQFCHWFYSNTLVTHPGSLLIPTVTIIFQSQLDKFPYTIFFKFISDAIIIKIRNLISLMLFWYWNSQSNNEITIANSFHVQSTKETKPEDLSPPIVVSRTTHPVPLVECRSSCWSPGRQFLRREDFLRRRRPSGDRPCRVSRSPDTVTLWPLCPPNSRTTGKNLKWPVHLKWLKDQMTVKHNHSQLSLKTNGAFDNTLHVQKPEWRLTRLKRLTSIYREALRNHKVLPLLHTLTACLWQHIRLTVFLLKAQRLCFCFWVII